MTKLLLPIEPLGTTAASAAQDEPLDKKAKKPKKTAAVVAAQAEPLDKKAAKPKKASAVAKKMKKVSASEGSGKFSNASFEIAIKLFFHFHKQNLWLLASLRLRQ